MSEQEGEYPMEHIKDQTAIQFIRKNLMWIGCITGLIGVKLMLSFLFPGLRTPGELLLSGALLLIYTGIIFATRSKIVD